MPDPDAKCCAPPRQSKARFAPTVFAADPTAERPATALIPPATALVGTAQDIIKDDGEAPLRQKKVSRFEISTTATTNAEFAQFVDATGYRTEAEHIGWSFVFWDQVPQSAGPTRGVQGVEWWRAVAGAQWNKITGPDCTLVTERPDHPVVHVSWNDARAYASWAGGRLPTEAEWEHAARGGLGDVRFPWGDLEPNDVDTFPCNIWQGPFPQQNAKHDGFAHTAPVTAFAPNGYGLYNMVGNVWEWTSEPFRIRSQRKSARERQAQMKGFKLTKGGSFLCHKSYCYRYRIAARTGNSPDSATTHMGFRVVWDV